MGARGPAPKPTAIKRLQGDRGKRPLNEREPTLPPGVPDCPDHLDEVARRERARVSSLLLRMRVVTEADYIGLAKPVCGVLNDDPGATGIERTRSPDRNEERLSPAEPVIGHHHQPK